MAAAKKKTALDSVTKIVDASWLVATASCPAAARRAARAHRVV
jgi:hypothetical protein